MYFTFIAIAIWILSGLGIGFMIWRKLPALISVSEKQKLTSTISLRSPTGWIKNLEWEKTLQKPLLRLRLFVLKIENKITALLEKLHRRSEEKKNNNSSKIKKDSYWEELKKFKR